MNLGSFKQQPADRLDYVISAEDWLTTGDTIASVVVPVVRGGTGLTVNASVVGGNTIVVWVSGGTSGVSYTIEVTFTTASTPVSRIKQFEFKVAVEDK